MLTRLSVTNSTTPTPSSGSTTGAVIGFAVLNLLIGVTFSFLPWCMRSTNTKKWFSCANAFGAGCFIAVSFTHLSPESVMLLDSIQGQYPTAFTLIGLSFVLVFIASTAIELWVGQRKGEQIPLLSFSDKSGKTSKSVLDGERIGTHSKDGVNVIHYSIVWLFMVLHAALEGLVLGFQSSTQEVVALGIAIAVHKWVEAYVIGTLCVRTRRWSSYRLGTLLAYSMATPAGIAVGALLQQTASNTALGVVNALATGAFMYVGLHELLVTEFYGSTGTIFTALKLGLLALGFGVVALLPLLEL